MFASGIFVEEGIQSLVLLSHRFVSSDVDVLIFDCLPQMFDHDVVQSATFVIHTVAEFPTDHVATRPVHHRWTDISDHRRVGCR